MSARHLWIQTRLLEHCRELGYAAIPEDPNTRADIFVPQPPYALEVQLRPTQFERRTASRTAKGADTIWFVGHDVDYNDKLVKRAMWRLPSARVKVYDRRRTWAGRPRVRTVDRRGRHLWRNPLGRHPEIASHAHWVEPLLVGQIEFREATSGSLRHPAWKAFDRTSCQNRCVHPRHEAMGLTVRPVQKCPVY